MQAHPLERGELIETGQREHHGDRGRPDQFHHRRMSSSNLLRTSCSTVAQR